MKLVKKIGFFSLIALFIGLISEVDTVYAAAPPPPPPPCETPPCPPDVPIDGGIGFLAAAGMYYGIKKLYGAKKGRRDIE